MWLNKYFTAGELALPFEPGVKEKGGKKERGTMYLNIGSIFFFSLVYPNLKCFEIT